MPVGCSVQPLLVPAEGMLGEEPVPEAGEEKDARTRLAGRPSFPRWHCGVFFISCHCQQKERGGERAPE